MLFFCWRRRAQELRGQLEVGLIAGRHIFGDKGGQMVGAIICLGLLASISSMTWIGPRVTMSMGEDHWLLRFLGRKNRNGVPANAVLVQMVIVCLLLLTRSFELVVIYIQFSLLLCSLLTVVGRDRPSHKATSTPPVLIESGGIRFHRSSSL